MKRLKTALVLGGGGARGLAHIGVLKVLRAHRIPIDIVTGTSIGALVGALYAYKQDVPWLEERVRTFLGSERFIKAGSRYFKQQARHEPDDLLHQLSQEIKKRVVINLAAHRVSLMKGERLQLTVDELIPNVEFGELQLPFACSAAELNSGKCQTFTSGHLRKALRASASIPGIIPPLEHKGQLYVDGSVCDNIPVNAALDMGAEFIIAVNVSQNMPRSTEFNNVIDIIIRANQISTHKIDHLLLQKASCVITPRIGHFHWSDFEKYDTLIEEGEKGAEQVVTRLKQQLRERNSPYCRFKLYLKKKLEQTLGGTVEA